MVTAGTQIVWDNFCIFLYLLSNGITAKNCIPWHWPTFEVKQFETLISWERSELEQKYVMSKYQVFYLFTKIKKISKLLLQICFHLYGNHRRVTLVDLTATTAEGGRMHIL